VLTALISGAMMIIGQVQSIFLRLISAQPAEAGKLRVGYGYRFVQCSVRFYRLTPGAD
jgi:hypothetical protein